MPITTCTRCSKLYIERSEEAANEPDRKCPTCFKGGAAAYGLEPPCSPIVRGCDQGTCDPDDDMRRHVVDLDDTAGQVQRDDERSRRLQAAALAMVRRLETLGFGDVEAEISGADAIDAINEHFSSLREALAQ